MIQLSKDEAFIALEATLTKAEWLKDLWKKQVQVPGDPSGALTIELLEKHIRTCQTLRSIALPNLTPEVK